METSSKLTLTPEELRAYPSTLFTLLDKLGEGSYGVVHKAIHKRTGIIVAIKLISIDGNIEETTKEINIHTSLDCDYIVKCYGSYIFEDFLWIIMEYCGTGSVSDIMRLNKITLSEPQIAVILSYVLRGLEYLHDNSKIHRDIKAGNILLNSDGESKLADFGVAGQLVDDKHKRITVIGTPFWMAPEVIQEVGYGTVADIWSLGITCIEMAQGYPPHHNIHPMRAIFMIPSKPPPKLDNESKFSEKFIAFIARCLTKNPNDRPSAKELLLDPFITSAPNISILNDIVQNTTNMILKGALSKDDDYESESEMENDDLVEINFNNPSVRASFMSEGDMTIKQDQRSAPPHTQYDAFGTVKSVVSNASSTNDSVVERETGTMLISGASKEYEKDTYQPEFIKYIRKGGNEAGPSSTSPTTPTSSNPQPQNITSTPLQIEIESYVTDISDDQTMKPSSLIDWKQQHQQDQRSPITAEVSSPRSDFNKDDTLTMQQTHSPSAIQPSTSSLSYFEYSGDTMKYPRSFGFELHEPSSKISSPKSTHAHPPSSSSHSTNNTNYASSHHSQTLQSPLNRSSKHPIPQTAWAEYANLTSNAITRSMEMLRNFKIDKGKTVSPTSPQKQMEVGQLMEIIERNKQYEVFEVQNKFEQRKKPIVDAMIAKLDDNMGAS